MNNRETVFCWRDEDRAFIGEAPVPPAERVPLNARPGANLMG